MNAGKLELGIIFLTQTGVGILGNSFFLFLHNLSLLTGRKLRSMDLILNQLALANTLVLFSKGIPQTVVAFRWKYVFDDAGCKLVFYYYRVGTGVSFSTMCLLNGFQVIKLTPSRCRWVQLKIRSPTLIGYSCCLCWIMHLLINSFIIVLVSAPVTRKNFTERKNYGYCSWMSLEKYSSLYAVLYFFPELVCLIFIIWTSGSMVLVLYRHKKRVQYIHHHQVSLGPSHEARATHTILVLVSSFVIFYSVCTILSIWTTLVANPGQWVLNSSVLMISCFPAFSPFMFIISNTRTSQFCTWKSQFCFVCCRLRKTMFPNLEAVL